MALLIQNQAFFFFTVKCVPYKSSRICICFFSIVSLVPHLPLLSHPLLFLPLYFFLYFALLSISFITLLSILFLFPLPSLFFLIFLVLCHIFIHHFLLYLLHGPNPSLFALIISIFHLKLSSLNFIIIFSSTSLIPFSSCLRPSSWACFVLGGGSLRAGRGAVQAVCECRLSW